MDAISGKTVMISGASSGIGRATAKLMAAAGASVMLVARREKNLQDLKREIEDSGGAAIYQTVDVTDRLGFQNAAQSAIEQFGRIDVLFNNAGIMPLSFMKKLHVD